MDSSQVATGFIRGTGAAVNVSLGWIPEFVQVINVTDGDITHANPLAPVLLFTSGGTSGDATTEIKAGDKLHDNVTDGTATIRQVIVDSGSWAAGDAAGWFILDAESQVGVFAAASTAYREGVDADAFNGVTLTAAADTDGIDVDTEVAGTTSAAVNCIAYDGTRGGLAKGFTIGATISEDTKLLYYYAFHGDFPFDQTAAP
jgi:hypothetical protein